jgi:hypothetical protein
VILEQKGDPRAWAKVSAVRWQTTKSGEKISPTAQLLELVGSEGPEYREIIEQIGKGRVQVVDHPDVTKWQKLRAKIENATDATQLHKLVGNHPALEHYSVGSAQLMDKAQIARRINDLVERAAQVGQRRQELLAKEMAANERLASYKVEHAGEFKGSEDYVKRQKERYNEGQKKRKAWQASLNKIEKLHAHHAEVRARGQVESKKLHEMGGVEDARSIRYHQRTINSLAKKNAQLEAGRPGRLFKLQAKGYRRQSKLGSDLYNARLRAYSREDTLRREAQKAAEYAAVDAQHANPRIAAENFKVLDSMPDHAFPEAVAERLSKIEAVAQHPEGFEDVAGWWWRQMSRWKLLVTVLNPIGYRFRNTTSDIWNMYMNGMPLRAIPFYMVKAFRLLRKARNDPTAAAFVLRAEMHGAMQGMWRGDIEHAYALLEHGKTINKIPILSHYVKFQVSANTTAENVGRMAHLLWRMDHAKSGWRGPAEAGGERQLQRFARATSTTRI